MGFMSISRFQDTHQSSPIAQETQFATEWRRTAMTSPTRHAASSLSSRNIVLQVKGFANDFTSKNTDSYAKACSATTTPGLFSNCRMTSMTEKDTRRFQLVDSSPPYGSVPLYIFVHKLQSHVLHERLHPVCTSME